MDVSPAGYACGMQPSEMMALIIDLRAKLDIANALLAATAERVVPSFPARALFCQRQRIGLR